MHPIIFPFYTDSRWVEVDLNELAVMSDDYQDVQVINPRLDPIRCGEWVESIAHFLLYDLTYGGFLEERQFLWRDHPYYGSWNGLIHLGVDFNVPTGTTVTVPETCRVILVDNDGDTEGGWGHRILFQTVGDGTYFLYGHLSPHNLPTVGRIVDPGAVVGHVGHPPIMATGTPTSMSNS